LGGGILIGFFLNIVKLLKAIWRAVKRDEDFLLLLLLAFLFSGTYFYWHVEGWSVVDALYFSFMTMSTIGYGDLVPTTPLSKIFTIVYSLLTIGLFAAIVAKLVIATVSDKKRSHARKSEE
jgi:voltage-gated potassium channel